MILKILSIGILTYLVGAVIYHKRDKSLTQEVLLEYLLTAILVLILIAGVIY